MRGIQQYQSVNVNSGVLEANPHRIIQMLMAGVIDRTAIAKGHIQRNEADLAGRVIGKTIDIINGLQVSLDMDAGGEISQDLSRLYDYMIKRLYEANKSHDEKILDEVAKLMGNVKEGWDAIPQVEREKHASRKQQLLQN